MRDRPKAHAVNFAASLACAAATALAAPAHAWNPVPLSVGTGDGTVQVLVSEFGQVTSVPGSYVALFNPLGPLPADETLSPTGIVFFDALGTVRQELTDVLPPFWSSPSRSSCPESSTLSPCRSGLGCMPN